MMRAGDVPSGRALPLSMHKVLGSISNSTTKLLKGNVKRMKRQTARGVRIFAKEFLSRIDLLKQSS
jgi:hypothetical protein